MLLLAAVTIGFCGFVSAIVCYGQYRQMTDYWRGMIPAARCPKCAAVNRERVKNELEPLPPASIRVRSRDRALYCTRCEHAFYKMSEDTVMRYDERYYSSNKEAA